MGFQGREGRENYNSGKKRGGIRTPDLKREGRGCFRPRPTLRRRDLHPSTSVWRSMWGGPESRCLPSMCAAGEKAMLNGGSFVLDETLIDGDGCHSGEPPRLRRVWDGLGRGVHADGFLFRPPGVFPPLARGRPDRGIGRFRNLAVKTLGERPSDEEVPKR